MTCNMIYVNKIEGTTFSCYTFITFIRIFIYSTKRAKCFHILVITIIFF